MILCNAANKETNNMENEVKIPDYIQRMIEEKKELDERIAKLIASRYSENDYEIDRDQRNLMDSQFEVMTRYSRILSDRIYIGKVKAGVIAPPSPLRQDRGECCAEVAPRY